jgi:elongation factor Ts
VSSTAYKASVADIKRLRDETGAGMADCNKALVEAQGDYERAKARLNEIGAAKAEKKSAERTATEGLVGSYIHAGGKIGVLVEVNCETDFVARNERFQGLIRDVAMHVAAMSPQYLDRESVPADVIEPVKADLEKTLPPGKPPEVIEKILSGKLNKWYEEHTLLEQPFVKDDSMTVGELVKSVAGVLGEKIAVKRYVKFALGDE